MHAELTQAVANLEKQTVLTLVQQQLEDGHDALAILEACRKGMAIVGERFQEGDYFVSELIYSAAIFKQVAQVIEPALANVQGQSDRGVVIGTVQGDIHDIGKDLVVVLLKAAGYTVHDLGVDVPPQQFVEALQETGAVVLGLSALLTAAFPAMKATVEAVDAASLRPGVKIMIGGGPVNETVRQFTGADAWGADAQSAVDLCRMWLEEASDDGQTGPV